MLIYESTPHTLTLRQKRQSSIKLAFRSKTLIPVPFSFVLSLVVRVFPRINRLSYRPKVRPAWQVLICYFFVAPIRSRVWLSSHFRVQLVVKRKAFKTKTLPGTVQLRPRCPSHWLFSHVSRQVSSLPLQPSSKVFASTRSSQPPAGGARSGQPNAATQEQRRLVDVTRMLIDYRQMWTSCVQTLLVFTSRRRRYTWFFSPWWH